MSDPQPPAINPPGSEPGSEQQPFAQVLPTGGLVFSDLAHGAREIIIEHHGQVYRLRLTRNDKLILSK